MEHFDQLQVLTNCLRSVSVYVLLCPGLSVTPCPGMQCQQKKIKYYKLGV